MNLPVLPSLTSLQSPDSGPAIKGSDEACTEKSEDVSAFSTLFAVVASPAMAFASAEPVEAQADAPTGGKGGKDLPGGLPGSKVRADGVTLAEMGTPIPFAAASGKAGNNLPDQPALQAITAMMAQAEGLGLSVKQQADNSAVPASPIAASRNSLALEATLSLAALPVEAGQSPIVTRLAAQTVSTVRTVVADDQGASPAMPTVQSNIEPEGNEGAEPTAETADLPKPQSLSIERPGSTISMPHAIESRDQGARLFPTNFPAVHEGQVSATRVEELVQAIATAREGEAGQPVRTTLSHAEFGVLRLRLSHGDDGLSAQIASADAGFAPAAQTAVRSLAEAAAQPRSDDQPRHQHNGQDQMRNHAEAGTHSGSNQRHGQQETASGERASRGMPSPSTTTEENDAMPDQARSRPRGSLFA